MKESVYAVLCVSVHGARAMKTTLYRQIFWVLYPKKWKIPAVSEAPEYRWSSVIGFRARSQQAPSVKGDGYIHY